VRCTYAHGPIELDKHLKAASSGATSPPAAAASSDSVPSQQNTPHAGAPSQPQSQQPAAQTNNVKQQPKTAVRDTRTPSSLHQPAKAAVEVVASSPPTVEVSSGAASPQRAALTSPSQQAQASTQSVAGPSIYEHLDGGVVAAEAQTGPALELTPEAARALGLGSAYIDPKTLAMGPARPGPAALRDVHGKPREDGTGNPNEQPPAKSNQRPLASGGSAEAIGAVKGASAAALPGASAGNGDDFEREMSDFSFTDGRVDYKRMSPAMLAKFLNRQFAAARAAAIAGGVDAKVAAAATRHLQGLVFGSVSRAANSAYTSPQQQSAVQGAAASGPAVSNQHALKTSTPKTVVISVPISAPAAKLSKPWASVVKEHPNVGISKHSAPVVATRATSAHDDSTTSGLLSDNDRSYPGEDLSPTSASRHEAPRGRSRSDGHTDRDDGTLTDTSRGYSIDEHLDASSRSILSGPSSFLATLRLAGDNGVHAAGEFQGLGLVDGINGSLDTAPLQFGPDGKPLPRQSSTDVRTAINSQLAAADASVRLAHMASQDADEFLRSVDAQSADPAYQAALTAIAKALNISGLGIEDVEEELAKAVLHDETSQRDHAVDATPLLATQHQAGYHSALDRGNGSAAGLSKLDHLSPLHGGHGATVLPGVGMSAAAPGFVPYNVFDVGRSPTYQQHPNTSHMPYQQGSSVGGNIVQNDAAAPTAFGQHDPLATMQWQLGQQLSPQTSHPQQSSQSNNQQAVLQLHAMQQALQQMQMALNMASLPNISPGIGSVPQASSFGGTPYGFGGGQGHPGHMSRSPIMLAPGTVLPTAMSMPLPPSFMAGSSYSAMPMYAHPSHFMQTSMPTATGPEGTPYHASYQLPSGPLLQPAWAPVTSPTGRPLTAAAGALDAFQGDGRSK
jgi:hypothetical protein